MTRGTIPPARWVSWLQLLTRRATRHQIAGQSMDPTLSAGDVVVVDRKATPKVGDVVVCRHPFKTDGGSRIEGAHTVSTSHFFEFFF